MEDLIANICKHLRVTHPLYAITPYADVGGVPEEWVFRSSRPGLIPFSFYALYQGCRLLRRWREAQVILAGSAMVAPLALLLARLFGRKAIVLVHGLDLIYPSGWYQAFCVRWVKHCDRVIANSDHTASLAKKKKVGRLSLHVIPPGVDCDLFNPKSFPNAKAEWGLKDRKIILFVGRLARRKGVAEFVQNCIPEIIAEVPEAMLLIVGGNPKDSLAHRDDVEGEIEARVRDVNLSSHVRQLGWMADEKLKEIYKAADLLVMPALSMKGDVEGFGIVILEAAAAGIPTVATRVGGIPDAVEEGKSGILVEPGDYAGMTEAIVSLLRDDPARNALGRYAQKRAFGSYSWKVIIAKHEEILYDLTCSS
jgi:phosphatidylinositol alpha-1,6-mannosyltransferase